MHVAPMQLKPLKNISLSEDETKMLSWLQRTAWEAQPGIPEPIPYKTKVPEFFSGVRLYRMQGGGSSQGALDLFIKKLEYQGIIARQGQYPVSGHGASRFLSLTKAELENLGVGKEAEED